MHDRTVALRAKERWPPTSPAAHVSADPLVGRLACVPYLSVTSALLLVLRVAFVGALVVMLALGVEWALDTEELPPALPRSQRDGESRQVTAETAPEPESPASASPTDPASPSATPSASPSPSPMGPPPGFLIAAARAPQETTVQVLDAGGGGGLADAAADALDGLGYDIVSRASARADVTVTTVWFTEANEAQALGLRARDDRFADVAPNAGLSAGVDLHVLVGPDWS